MTREKEITKLREIANCKVILSQVHEAEIETAKKALAIIDSLENELQATEKMYQGALDFSVKKETEIKELKEKLEWRPIESAPKGPEILIGWFDLGEKHISVAFWHDIKQAWSTPYTVFTQDKNWQPTHWMPLPKPSLEKITGGKNEGN